MDDLNLDLTMPEQKKGLELDLTVPDHGPDASVNLLGASMSNPEEEAKLRNLSMRSGLPRELIAGDVKNVQQETEYRENMDIMNFSPPLQRFVARNPEDAKVIYDEFKPFSSIGDGILDIGRGFSQTLIHNEIGREGYLVESKKTLGMETGGNYQRIHDLELEMKNFPQNPGIMAKIGGFAGGLYDQINHSLPALLGGIGLGAVAGAGTPLSAVSIPAGAGAGLLAGMATDAAKVSAGHTYLALEAVRDSEGNPLPEGAKLLGSATAGVLVGALNAIGIKHVGNFAEKAVDNMVSTSIEKIMAEAMTNPTAMQRLGQLSSVVITPLAESATIGAAIGGAQTVSETTGQVIGGLVGTLTGNTEIASIFNDQGKLEEFSQNLMGSMLDGALLMGALRIPAVGSNLVADFARANQAQVFRERMETVFKQIQETEALRRDPSVIKNYVDSLNNQKISIPVDKVLDLYAQVPSPDGFVGHVLGAKDGPLGYVKDLIQQVETAKRSGGDVYIGLGDYFAFTKPEVHDLIKDHLRENGEAFTVVEAQVALEQVPNYGKSLWHGTGVPPFSAFDSAFMGTGEGAQAFGWGHYLAEREKIGRTYYETLSDNEFFVDGKLFDTKVIDTDPMAAAAMALYHANGFRLEAAREITDWTDMTTADAHTKEIVRILKSNEPIPIVEEKLSGTLFNVRVKRTIDEFIHQDENLANQPPKVRAVLEKLGLEQRDDGIYVPVNGKMELIGQDLHEVREHFAYTGRAPTYIKANGNRIDPSNMRDMAGAEIADQMGSILGAVDEATAEKTVVEYKRNAISMYEQEVQDLKDRLARLEVDPEAVIKEMNHPQIHTAEGVREFTQGWIDGGEQEIAQSKEIIDYILRGDYEKNLTWNDGKSQGDLNKAFSEKLAAEGIAGFRFYDGGSRRRVDELKELNSKKAEYEKDIAEYGPGVGDFEGKFVDKLDKVNEKIAELNQELADREGPNYNVVVIRDQDLEITHANGVEIPSALVKKDPVAVAVSDAVQQGVETERKMMWLDPMFETPKAAGMTKQQFKLYSEHLQEVQRQITMGVFKAVEREVARRETKLWKDSIAKAVEQVSTDLRGNENGPSVHMADFALRANENPAGEQLPIKMQLDPNAVDVMYGDTNIRSQMNDKWFAAKEGYHPDALASTFGYNSGKEMMDALLGLETERRDAGKTPRQYFDIKVKEEATRRVEAENGKLDERILKEALEAALSVKQIDVLIDEMSRLAQDAPISREALEAQIKADHGAMSIEAARDVKGFERQTGKYGREAEIALLKGDFAAAFQAKQKQLTNFILAREAKAFDKDMDSLEATANRFGSERVVSGVDQAYTDQVHNLMRRADQNTPRSEGNLDEATRGKSFDRFILDKEGDGYVFDVPFWVREDYVPSMDNMTKAQASEFKRAIDSLVKNGRDEKKINLLNESLDRKETIAKIVDNIESLRESSVDWEKTGPPSVKKGASKLTRWADSNLLKMEQMFQWFDKRDSNGPLNTVFRALKEAQFARDDMLKDLGKQLGALHDKGLSRDKNELVTNTSLMDRKGNPMKITRGNLIMMALNMGNEGNFQVLAKGRGWDETALHNFVANNLKPDEVKFINGLFDITNKMWPKVQEVTKELSGVAVEKVEARSFMTRSGEVKGGYYPLIKDSGLARTKEGVRTEDLFDNRFFNPFADASAMHERTGATYPVDLTFDQLAWKLRELTHGLAFRGPVREATKVLFDPKVMEAISDKIGPEYADQIRPWLTYVANDGSVSSIADSASLFNRAYAEGRANAVTMLIGLKVSTALIHGGAALFNSMGEVRPDRFLAVSGRMMLELGQGKRDTWLAAIEESGELRNRSHNLDRDLGAAMDAMMGDPSTRRQFMVFATSLVAMLDKLSAVPTYVAAKELALEKGMSAPEAIFFAEQTVRNAHGASAAMDTSAVQRSNALSGMTMFFGYFNHNYNRLRDTGRLTGEGQFGKALWRTMTYLVAPAFIHEAIRGHSEEDDSWGKMAAKAMVSQIGASVPFVRDATYYLMSGHGGSSPIQELLTAPLKPIKDANKWLENDEEPSKWVQHFADGVGWMTGFGTKTMSSAAQTGYELYNGTLDFDELDAWSMFLDMKPKAKEKK